MIAPRERDGLEAATPDPAAARSLSPMAIRVAVVAAALLLSAAPSASAARIATADRAAITAVLNRYVPAALERKDLRLAYELSGPYVRGGMTLKEWLHGGIPVYPFPA